MSDHFLGSRQLGHWLDIPVQVTNLAGAPAMPTDPPMLTIRRTDGTSVYAKEMPVVSKDGTDIGLFNASVFLGDGFHVGWHTAQVAYTVGSDTVLEHRTFEVVGGGHPSGMALGCHFFRKPNRDSVVYQVESGRLLKGSNPKVS